MAATLHSNCSALGLHPRASLPHSSPSFRSKVFMGLKPLSSYPFPSVKPNPSFQFLDNLGYRKDKPARAQVYGRYRRILVPYRDPGSGMWQMMDVWNFLYRERFVFLGTYVTNDVSNQVLATMLYLDSVSSPSQKLFLYIVCPGGDVHPGMALYDTLRGLHTPLITHNGGHAYNLGAYILSVGTKGKRSSVRSGRVALHPVAGVARGQADDVDIEANELLRIRDFFYEEFAKNTGQPIEKVQKDLNLTKRFNSQEALEYGIIDRIINPHDIKTRGVKRVGTITGKRDGTITGKRDGTITGKRDGTITGT
ncbi:hypothetical protein Dimus_034947 [Dionaea muscipula]